MDISKTSLFENFGAKNFCYLPRAFVPNLNLYRRFLKTAFEIPGYIDHAKLYFGPYHPDCQLEDSAFDYPNSGNENAKAIIADNWRDSVERVLGAAEKKKSVFMFTAEYLAHLSDPRPLLLAVKKAGLVNGSYALVCFSEAEGYARSWEREELKSFFQASGFDVTIPLKSQPDIWKIGITESRYSAYLASLGFQSGALDMRTLILTTEDSSVRPTGGIGTYVSNLKKLNPEVIVLYCDTRLQSLPSGQEKNCVLPRSLVGDVSMEQFFEGMGLVEAVRGMLYLFPHLIECEVQDYRSLGFRVVQAKRTGALPGALNMRVFLHGSVDYIKYGDQSDSSMMYSGEDSRTAVRDSYIFRNADEAWLPSVYLRDLMTEEFGYTLAPTTIRRLPFDVALLDPPKRGTLKSVKRIIFIGKYTNLKGWPDFMRAIVACNERGSLQGIEEIISICPGKPLPKDKKILRSLKKYKFLSMSHDGLMKYLMEARQDALFIIPSRGENYPNVILEQLLSGNRFICYSSGGAKEVVGDSAYTDRFFCPPGFGNLSERIDEYLKLDTLEFDGIICRKAEEVRQRQIEINEGFKKSSTPYLGKKPIDEIENLKVTVVTPFYNTPIKYLSDIYESLLASHFPPAEWIIVNDGSTESASRDLKEFALTCTARFLVRIESKVNGGLASARNYGLAYSKTEFTFFLDSDDVLLPQTLGDSVAALMQDKSSIVATGFAIYFMEKEKLPTSPKLIRDGVFWKPLGVPEARALALFENQYLTACAMYRTDEMRKLGGWDDSDKSMWEDWALYSKLAWSNLKFCLIPSAGYLYRTTPGSMSKTYNKYFSNRRLIRNNPVLNRLDVNIIRSFAHPGKLGEDGYLSPLESRMIYELRRLRNNKVFRLLFRRLTAALNKIVS